MPLNKKIINLEGFILPESSHIRRKHVRPENRQSDHYLATYDNTTLIYDCFFQPQVNRYILTAPRFLNLWALIKKHLFIDGQRYQGRLKRFTWQRCEQVEISAPANAKLQIQLDDILQDIPVRNTAMNLFSGLNVAMAMNKNNSLDWIRDWAEYHVNAQNLQGVCLIDNASTNYTIDDILSELETIKGLAAIAVVHAPFSYGPVDRSKKLEISPRFLQTSMFNLVRRDLFHQARAILSVDIDELVMSNSPENVFDAAVNSRLGAVSFREIKTYPNEGGGKAYAQRKHSMVKQDSKPGNTKWCVKGQGFMNNFGWAVHRFGGGFFPLTETKSFNYFHCQSTSTNWKKNRLKKQEDLVESAEVKATLTRYLP